MPPSLLYILWPIPFPFIALFGITSIIIASSQIRMCYSAPLDQVITTAPNTGTHTQHSINNTNYALYTNQRMDESYITNSKLQNHNYHHLPIPNDFDMANISIIFSDVDGTLVHYPSDTSSISNHMSEDDDVANQNMIYLPPSSTGRRGVISRKTLQLIHQLRQLRYHSGKGRTPLHHQQQQQQQERRYFVLISGMRTTTLLKRLPYLPLADVYCSENGGRIFYLEKMAVDAKKETKKKRISGYVGDGTMTLSTTIDSYVFKPIVVLEQAKDKEEDNDVGDTIFYRLREDLIWKKKLSDYIAAGFDGYQGAGGDEAEDEDNEKHKRYKTITSNTIPLKNRNGKLWEFARCLENKGWTLDYNGYSASFRVHYKEQKMIKDMHNNNDNGVVRSSTEDFHILLKSSLPDDGRLVASVNLGNVDIYPQCSGKKNCCMYLMDALSAGNLEDNSIFLCDDDNDLELAMSCRLAFVPFATSKGMSDLISKHPRKIVCVIGTGKNGVGNDDTTSMETTHCTELVLESILLLGK